MQLQAGAIVGCNRRNDRAVAEAAGLTDELRQQRPTNTTSLMDRIDVHEILHYVEAALVPRKQSCPPDHPAVVRGHYQLGSFSVRFPPGSGLLGAERLRIDGGERLVHRPVVDADYRLQVVPGRRADAESSLR